jgi:hypothetical protein
MDVHTIKGSTAQRVAEVSLSESSKAVGLIGIVSFSATLDVIDVLGRRSMRAKPIYDVLHVVRRRPKIALTIEDRIGDGGDTPTVCE